MEFRVVETTKPDYRIGIVVYREDVFYAKLDGKEYIVDYDFTKCKTVYSLPANDKHKAWTKRKVSKLNIAAAQWWAGVMPGLKVKGYIINNKFKLK